MKIDKITILPILLPRKSKFGVRTGAYDTLPNVYLRIDTTDGAFGYGEAAPIDDYYGETQKVIVHTLNDYYGPALIGQDPMNINHIMSQLDTILPGNPCAKAAVDIALHDLKGKVLGVAIAELLGGRFHDKVPLTCSVGIDSPEQMKENVQAAAQAGFRTIKLKGGADIAEDVCNLRTAREAIGQEGPWLRLDANGGYRNTAEIWRYVEELESFRMALLEQPFPAQAWDALRALRDRINIPILLDESMQTGTDLHRVAESRAGFVANIKLQNSGGFLWASQLVYAAARFDIPVMIGSQRESAIGNTASIQLAAIVERLDYTCDQRYALAVRDDANVVLNAPTLTKPDVDVPTGPGLGIDVDWEGSKRLAESTLNITA